MKPDFKDNEVRERSQEDMKEGGTIEASYIFGGILGSVIIWSGIFAVYMLLKKVAGETAVMRKIKSLFESKEFQIGILAGMLFRLLS